MKKMVTAGIIGLSSCTLLLPASPSAAQETKREKKAASNHSLFNHLRDFNAPPLALEGAKVSTEYQAKKLVSERYFSMMLKRRGLSATEGERVVGIETLGFDMPGFAKKGDAIWEVRIIDLVSGLNAIAWVHSQSAAVKFLLLPVPLTSGEGSPVWTLPVAMNDDARVIDAMLSEARQLIHGQELQERLKHGDGLERLKAKCAILSFRSRPGNSLQEARALKEPFFASLTLGGIAAILQKSDPNESEKLYTEAEKLALTITHYTREDATSIGYLYRLLPGYDRARALRLWERAVPALIQWDGSGHSSSRAMRELSTVTVQINPEGVETFWKTYVPWSKNHYWDSAEILARAITKQSLPDARKRVDEWHARGVSDHNTRAFQQAVLEELALRDLPAATEWIKTMRASERMYAAFELTMILMFTGRISEARQVLEYLEQEAKADVANTAANNGTADNGGARWLGDLIPRLRERLQEGKTRPPTAIGVGDVISVVMSEGMPWVATPDVIDEFLKNPRTQQRMFGGIGILEMPQIQFRDDAQAARLITAALPLADKVMEGGYPLHGSPRSQVLGTLALIEATRGNWQRAHDLIGRISIPELRAFYLLEAVEVADPLPETVRGWPLEFWPPTSITIG